MSTCPICSQVVSIQESDYGGIFVCPACKASFFVSFMGEPLAPSQPGDVSGADSRDVTPDAAATSSHVDSLQSLLEEEIGAEAEPITQPQDFSMDLQPSQEFQLQDSTSGLGSNDFLENQLAQETEMNSEHSPQSTGTEKTPQVMVNHFQNDASMMDLNEINQFANSPDVSLPLKYDLVISGIDTEAEVELLREALTDQRLGLDREAIIESMLGGQARIHNLNPVKASILFQRLRFDPFTIEVIEKKI